MTDRISKFQNLEVRVPSEDGAVCAVYHGTVGMGIEIGPEGLSGHTRGSLQEVLESVLKELRAEGYRASRHILGRTVHEARRPDTGDWHQNERRRRITAMLKDIEVDVRVDSGDAGVIFYGDGEIIVDIGRDVGVNRSADEQMFRELSTAVRSAQRGLGQQLGRARAEIEKQARRGFR